MPVDLHIWNLIRLHPWHDAVWIKRSVYHCQSHTVMVVVILWSESSRLKGRCAKLHTSSKQQ